LRRVGFDGAALEAVFADGEERPDLFEARAAELPQPRATALRLFVLGTEVTRADAVDALGDGLAAGIGLGALVGDDRIRATLRIVAHDVLLLASDLPSTDLADDHVAAAHLPSLTLARLTVRHRVTRALDVGTGNGIQALLLSRHADHVVAIDFNERALRFTELNAALNGRTNIETRAGSWLEPVAGERFGIVVCNPPYVVSPGSGLLYRDGDVRGDRLSERLVREMPTVLADGGYATVLVSWIPAAADDEPAPMRWSADSGCDSVVFTLHHETARESAALWEHEGELDSWLDFYRAEGIEEIAYGAVVLRRGGARPWQGAVELAGGPAGHAGRHLERIFAAHDLLEDATVGALPLALAPDAELDGTRLRLRGGLGLRAELDAAGAATRCRSRRSSRRGSPPTPRSRSLRARPDPKRRGAAHGRPSPFC